MKNWYVTWAEEKEQKPSASYSIEQLIVASQPSWRIRLTLPTSIKEPEMEAALEKICSAIRSEWRERSQ